METTRDVTDSDEVRRTIERLKIDGAAILESVLPLGTIEDLRHGFNERYDRFLEEQRRSGALVVGDRRYMISVELGGPFANPMVYANPSVLAVIRRCLGADAILESFGLVVALPGSDDQHRHRDAPPLFDEAISALVPPYALTVVFPLVEMNAVNGTTALRKGSHRYREVPESNWIAPTVPEGACAIWDYRTLHGGTANNSMSPRPILYCTYARPWWRDAVNYKRGGQRPLIATESFLASVPVDCRHLFAHVRSS